VVPLTAQWSRGRTVVNDALGSFLLRANEVIDQVPMSACGTFRSRDVRRESVIRFKAAIGRPI
jgi:hypothetical protein